MPKSYEYTQKHFLNGMNIRPDVLLDTAFGLNSMSTVFEPHAASVEIEVEFETNEDLHFESDYACPLSWCPACRTCRTVRAAHPEGPWLQQASG